MTATRRTLKARGFTLVEILIVVIILGILAAIVIPQFTNASTDAKKSNMASQDQTIKSQISLYMLQHNDTPPALLANWDQLTEVTDVNGAANPAAGTTSFGPYLQAPPTNPLTNSATVADISTTSSADGWYFNSTTGAFTGATTTGAHSDTGN
jgi:general secretion pathway protein G